MADALEIILKDGLYKTAHPESAFALPGVARTQGWDFVAFIPNARDGLYLYKRSALRSWIVRAALARVGGVK